MKIIVSGRLSEENLVQLRDLVDGFGVGTAVAYPPVIDFSAKIVEVQDKGVRSDRAKRGGLGGRKAVFRSKGFKDVVALDGTDRPKGSAMLLRQIMSGGKMTSEFKSLASIRAQVLKDTRAISTSEPELGWM